MILQYKVTIIPEVWVPESSIDPPQLPLTVGAPERKIDVFNRGPTVLRAQGGLGDYIRRHGLDWVPYF